MLIEFRVKNFRSFREEQVLSLVASRESSLEKNCWQKEDLHLLRSAALYGANASGKSNLVKAIAAMRTMVLESANIKPGDRLPVEPFLLDSKSQKKPTVMEVTFIHEGVRYQYGFAATRKRIEGEWLMAYPTPRARTWYSRTLDPDRNVQKFKYSPFLRGERKKLEDSTRDNALFLSVGAQWNNKQLSHVYNWFRDKLRVIDPHTSWRPITAKALLAEHEGQASQDLMHKYVVAFLKSADLGIEDIRVRKVDVSSLEFPKDMPSEIKQKMLQQWEDDPPLDIKLIHRVKGTGKSVAFNIEEESDGTQRFLKLAVPWLQAIQSGITIIMDELETSLHPLLTSELIRFIQKSWKANKGAQLVFTTHDVALLNPDLFRRDQIWFTEKDNKGATSLYSMWDYKEHRPRKGEAMEKGYLAGRYGAIPILEAFGIK